MSALAWAGVGVAVTILVVENSLLWWLGREERVDPPVMNILIGMTDEEEVVVEDHLPRLERNLKWALRLRRPLRVRLPLGQDLVINPKHILFCQPIWLSEKTTPNGQRIPEKVS